MYTYDLLPFFAIPLMMVCWAHRTYNIILVYVYTWYAYACSNGEAKKDCKNFALFSILGSNGAIMLVCHKYPWKVDENEKVACLAVGYKNVKVWCDEML